MQKKTSLLLAVDVGNTATNFGLFKALPRVSAPRPLKSWIISTKDLSAARSKKILRSHLQSLRHRMEGAIVSSVVPAADPKVRRLLHSFLGQAPMFVNGRSVSTVPVLYRHPEEVGADRIVNARAAVAFKALPAVIVDFGTATTFDCVSWDGAYLGGVIAPGPAISAQALYEKTAKLPFVRLEKPAGLLGRSTLESIQAGLYHGYRGLVKEIVGRLKKILGARTKVLSTGGQAEWILSGLDIIDRHVPHLTLMGLAHLWWDAHSNQSQGGRR